ncbi:MAG: hypothetical protein L3J96_05985 [Thermoplasmata archaeon]|nr:hypothetical protein [Thermoplasmata archaeon]
MGEASGMAVDWLSYAILLPELHATIGAAVVFGAYLLLRDLPPRRPDGRPRYPWDRIAIVVFLGIVLLKEALWDPVYEVNNPFLWQGVIDLGWYLIGAVIALGLAYARFRRL